jgi:galactokinase
MSERKALALPAPAQSALAALHAQTAEEGEAVVAWAPGRLNIIGEHTDYNDGFVLPVAVDHVVAMAGVRTAGTSALIYSSYYDERVEVGLGRDTLSAAACATELPRWARYMTGALAELADVSGHEPSGFEAVISGDVPVGGGMSSSSALTVASATFAARLSRPALAQMEPIEMARLCQRAEQRSSGVLGGIMDQAIACLGREGCAILLDCRSLEYEYVSIGLPGLELVVYDTCVPHTLAESAYNERRTECERAVALLAPMLREEAPDREVRSLRDISSADLARHGNALPEVLLRRARHVVEEDARVLLAVQALRAGDTDELGALLYASHASLRDNYAVSCPELDAVVEIASGVDGVVGARLMGAGFGGSALILVREQAVAELEATLVEAYSRRTGRVGKMHRCQSSDGARAAAIGARDSGE